MGWKSWSFSLSSLCWVPGLQSKIVLPLHSLRSATEWSEGQASQHSSCSPAAGADVALTPPHQSLSTALRSLHIFRQSLAIDALCTVGRNILQPDVVADGQSAVAARVSARQQLQLSYTCLSLQVLEVHDESCRLTHMVDLVLGQVCCMLLLCQQLFFRLMIMTWWLQNKRLTRRQRLHVC